MSNPYSENVDATPNLGEVLYSYGGLDYAWHEAIGEFVDNSIDSFERHSSELSDPAVIDITYEPKKMRFRIVDNAYGMNKEELDRAVKLAKENLYDDGIGKYGLGMKTAASWMGRYWTIKTKQKGESLEWTAIVDIEKLKKSVSNFIPFTSKFADEDTHYTIIEVKKLRRKIGGRSIGKTKENLKFLYPNQLLSGRLTINWGTEKLEYIPPEFLTETEDDGSVTTWLSDLPEDFNVKGHTLKGRFGIVKPGGKFVPYAGITLLWRNRVVIGGHRGAWKPDEIYGAGAGTLRRQRLWGEIQLDCLTPNQQKKGFIWMEFTMDDLENALLPIMKPAADYSETVRTSKKTKPTHGQMQMSDAKVKEGMESEKISQAMHESIKTGHRPTEDITDAAAEIMESKDPTPLRMSISDGEPAVHVFKNPDSHELERFMRTKNPEANLIKLFLNTNHSFFSEFVGDDIRRYELWQNVCIALALVQYNANRLPHTPEPAKLWEMLDEILKHLERQG